MTEDATADQIEVTLSSTQKSIVVRKDDEEWMQTVAEIEKVFRGIPVHVCMIRRIPRTEKEFFDCRNGLIFRQDRTRVITWVNQKKYTCTVKQLHRLLTGEIKALTMVKYVGRYGNCRG